MKTEMIEPTAADKILRVFGRERGLIINCNGSAMHGLYISAEARPESFWRALLRPKAHRFPIKAIAGYVSSIRSD